MQNLKTCRMIDCKTNNVELESKLESEISSISGGAGADEQKLAELQAAAEEAARKQKEKEAAAAAAKKNNNSGSAGGAVVSGNGMFTHPCQDIVVFPAHLDIVMRHLPEPVQITKELILQHQLEHRFMRQQPEL